MFLGPDISSLYYQPVGAPAYPQRSFSAKVYTPKVYGSFILESLIKISHQVNSRSLFDLCFTVVLYNKTRWSMLNVHLSYKPPSFWSIFWSGERPSKLIFLKIFRFLVVPGGGLRKGIIIQGVCLKHRFSCARWSCLIRKGDTTGSSVYAPRQSNIPYGQTYIQSDGLSTIPDDSNTLTR